QAPAAKNIIQQGIATPGLLSYIFINKYCNHMPYYRQSKNFERKGIDLSRATMDKWQLEVYEKLKPLERIMLEHVKTGKVLNMDETTTQILHYENGNTSRKKSYIWLAHGGPKDKPLAIYRYFESRSPQFIRPFINGFKGYLQTDEYPGYEAALKEHKILHPKDKIVHVACAAHIRRKFYDALLNGKSKNSAIALKYIQKMYYEENRLREQNLSDSEFIKKRKEIIKPIMDEFYNWMTEIQPTVPETFKFGKALDYAIKAWPHLMNYLDCPEIYLDNSIAERSIRPYVLSRKNFLFCGSEDGARSTCLLFSLIECAIINGINPEEYLSSIFELAADTTDWTDSKWSELLPWNIKLIKRSDVSTVLIA
ncbi:IS66 family transposase, partial [Treponema sp.]|uniref:IS66 family transposase n=1 Tax=Treponema sp. TaxID=166 RepID=UPI00298EAEC1